MKRNTVTAVALSATAIFLVVGPSMAAKITNTLAMHAMGFATNGDPGFSIVWSSGIKAAAGQYPCASAAIQLPDGAVIKTVKMYSSSTSGGNMPNITLLRTTIAEGTQVSVGQLLSNDTSGNRIGQKVTNLDLSKMTIDNKNYWYSVGACTDQDSTFHGMVITYTPPAP